VRAVSPVLLQAFTPAVAAVLLATAAVPRSAGGEPPVRAAARRAPYLWSVEKGGRKSHLFGTVHVGLDLDASLGEAGRTALDHAKRVFVEVDLTSADLFVTIVREAWARAELPPERSLRALLGPASWTRLTALYKGSVPPERLDRMEPWFAALSTMPLLAARHRSETASALQGKPPLDAAIATRAKKRGVPVTNLETTLQHILAFTAMGRSEAVTMIDEMISDPDAERREFDRLVRAYAAADDRQMVKEYGRLLRRKPAMAEHLLFHRNEEWCQRLDLWLVDGGMFVAAGAFHMLGERGLVEMLRGRGYRVERVWGPITGRSSATNSGERARSMKRRSSSRSASAAAWPAGSRVAVSSASRPSHQSSATPS
jgi:hypothetical protein